MFPVPGLARLNEKGNAFLELVHRYSIYLQKHDPKNPRKNHSYLITEANENFCPPNVQEFIDSIAYLERKKFNESKDREQGFEIVRKRYYAAAGYKQTNQNLLKKMTSEFMRAMYFNLQVSPTAFY